MAKRSKSWCIRLQLASSAAAEAGQTVTEYAVVLAVLLVALGGIVFALETQIETFMAQVGDKIAAILS
jgi:Flp pilus assembly pilin Flp